MKTTLLLVSLMFASLSCFAQGGPGGNQDSGFRQAMDECISESGVSKPERGQRPSDEDRAKVDACLESKGYSKPEGGPPGGGQR